MQSHKSRYNDTISRSVGSGMALDIDLLLQKHDKRHRKKADVIFPTGQGTILPVLETDLPALPVVGVIIQSQAQDLNVLALKLSSLALEKECEIVVISTHDYSGLERFGFRCERLPPAPKSAKQECLEQLKLFWGIEILI